MLGIVANPEDMERMESAATFHFWRAEGAPALGDIEVGSRFVAYSWTTGVNFVFTVLAPPYRDDQGRLRVKVEKRNQFEDTRREAELDLAKFGLDPDAEEEAATWEFVWIGSKSPRICV